VLKSGLRRPILAAALAVAGVAGAVLAAPADAAGAQQRIDLRVLVLTDHSVGVDTVVAQLDRESVPYTAIDLTAANRPAITAASLADTVSGVRRAKYQGVVVPRETSVTGAEATALAAFEREFAIRQIIAYTGATAAVGVTNAWSGPLDGTSLTVTAAGKQAGFGYLNATVPIDDRDPDVPESFGYLGTPGTGFTPLVTGAADGQTGSLLGVYAHDGREDLVVTIAMNRNQTHAMVLGHGLIQWLTKGVHIGHWRNWFSIHVDDVFLPDARWDAGENCTIGDGCDPSVTGTDIRMQPADVTKLLQWQQQSGVKVDMVFNGEGSVDAGASDPLTTSLLANKTKLRWVNHTYSHMYLGCVQDFTVTPWQCAKNADGSPKWVTQADISAQIKQNVDWARSKGISLTASELVTGEHSGLKSLPQMSVDNPNLAPALSANGIKVIASDASREPASRPIGPAVTEKRWPMNIYYNVGTTAEEVDEYNWIYTSRADGGSGICEDNPATSTCIAPLSKSSGFADYIVPIETRIAFDHIVSTDPAPHYAHQSNLTEDQVLYPVLDALLARYRATFTTATPLQNPTFTAVARQHQRQAAIRTANVEAYQQGGRVTIVNHGSAAVDVPVTVPAGTKTITVSLLGIEATGAAYGEAYGTERSGWTSVARNGQLLLRPAS
jgi:hypothetical protein